MLADATLLENEREQQRLDNLDPVDSVDNEPILDRRVRCFPGQQ